MPPPGGAMTATTIDAFRDKPEADRNAFLFLVALIWVGVLTGFDADSFDHIRRHGLDYPLIVHVHAVAFVGWLVLFTTQVLLIRKARADLHRRLGLAAIGLAAVMIVLGPATALDHGRGPPCRRGRDAGVPRRPVRRHPGLRDADRRGPSAARMRGRRTSG